MCMLAHGRNLNKNKTTKVVQTVREETSKLDGKLDNIFGIEGYRIRRYVDDEGKVVVIIVKKVKNEISERNVTTDALYDPNLL